MLSLLPFWFVAILCGATNWENLDKEELEKLIRREMWDEASNQISKMEKAGLCNGAVCPSANALILNAKGKSREAQEMARHAIEKLSEGEDLSAWQYNELGALLYRGAEGKREDL